MKLTNDYIKILSKLRDSTENGNDKTDSALTEISAITEKYTNYAERKKLNGFDRVVKEYDSNIKKIKAQMNYAKTLVYLLSEPGSSEWQLASDAIDSMIDPDK